MKRNKQVNNPQAGFTYERLKNYKGFENTTEAEAIKQIEIIEKLGKILYYMYMNDPLNFIDKK